MQRRLVEISLSARVVIIITPPSASARHAEGRRASPRHQASYGQQYRRAAPAAKNICARCRIIDNAHGAPRSARHGFEARAWRKKAKIMTCAPSRFSARPMRRARWRMSCRPIVCARPRNGEANVNRNVALAALVASAVGASRISRKPALRANNMALCRASSEAVSPGRQLARQSPPYRRAKNIASSCPAYERAAHPVAKRGNEINAFEIMRQPHWLSARRRRGKRNDVGAGMLATAGRRRWHGVEIMAATIASARRAGISNQSQAQKAAAIIGVKR